MNRLVRSAIEHADAVGRSAHDDLASNAAVRATRSRRKKPSFGPCGQSPEAAIGRCSPLRDSASAAHRPSCRATSTGLSAGRIFADGATKANDPSRVAGQSGLAVLLGTEELPHQVLAPPFHQFFVTEIEAVLEVEQAGHEANRQARSPRVAHAAAELLTALAEQIASNHLPWRSILPLAFGRQRGFDPGPTEVAPTTPQAGRECRSSRPGGNEKIRCAQARIPQKNSSCNDSSEIE